jgi:hypothetical protein
LGDTDDTERDAFGQPRAAAGRASAVPTAVPPAPEAAPVRREPRPNPLPLAFMVVAIAVTAFVLYRADHEAVDSPAVVGRELAGHALGERSLVRAPNFRRALAAIQAEMAPGEELLSLRLTPEELGSTVRDAKGNTRLVDVGLDFSVDARDWSTDTSSTPLNLAAIDPAAPEKVVRGALRAAHADDTHLNYVSLTGGDPPTWYLSLDDVAIADQTWTADLAGIAVTHPGQRPFAEGLAGRSLLREANLAAALAKVGEHGRQVTSLRLEPDRLDVTLRGDGRARDVQVDAAQRVLVRESPGGPSPAVVRLDQIDPAAPGRAFAKALRQGGLSPRKIGYAVLFSPTEWGLYFEDVPAGRAHWRASGDGRRVERVG